MRIIFNWAMLSGLPLLAFLAAPARAGELVERAELTMGTVAQVAIAGEAATPAAFEAAFAALRAVDAAMSLYRPESEDEP
jgi:thiamine biosynthesis lipoprotein ApbE